MVGVWVSQHLLTLLFQNMICDSSLHRMEILSMGGLTAAVSFLIGWFIEDVILSSGDAMGGLH
jgi:hypothetical protein